MGGVRTSLEGKSSIDRLYAAGEVACTGVHGANRLASNSLLEGVVFGARAGRSMREITTRSSSSVEVTAPPPFPMVAESTLRDLAWNKCGLIRSGAGLRDAISQLESMPFGACPRPAREQYELRNIHTVAVLIARCALAREESRGAHFRTDFPETLAHFQKHSSISIHNAVTFA
jgi:L-aspartate oxidase